MTSTSPTRASQRERKQLKRQASQVVNLVEETDFSDSDSSDSSQHSQRSRGKKSKTVPSDMIHKAFELSEAISTSQQEKFLRALQAPHMASKHLMLTAKEKYEEKKRVLETEDEFLAAIKAVQDGKAPAFLPTDLITGDTLLVPFALPCWKNGCQARFAPDTLIDFLHSATIDLNDACLNSLEDSNGLVQNFNDALFDNRTTFVDYEYVPMKCPGCRAIFTMENLRAAECVLPDDQVQPILRKHMRVLEFFRGTFTKPGKRVSATLPSALEVGDDGEFPLILWHPRNGPTKEVEYEWSCPCCETMTRDLLSSKALWKHLLSGDCPGIKEWRCPLNGCSQVLPDIKGHYSWLQPIGQAGKDVREKQNTRFLVMNALSLHLSECTGKIECRNPFARADRKCALPPFRAKNLMAGKNPLNPDWEHLHACKASYEMSHPLRIRSTFLRGTSPLGDDCHTKIVVKQDVLAPDLALFEEGEGEMEL